MSFGAPSFRRAANLTHLLYSSPLLKISLCAACLGRARSLKSEFFQSFHEVAPVARGMDLVKSTIACRFEGCFDPSDWDRVTGAGPNRLAAGLPRGRGEGCVRNPAGPPVLFAGKVHFAVDPKLAANRLISDIDCAPRNNASLQSIVRKVSLLLLGLQADTYLIIDLFRINRGTSQCLLDDFR
jgi:hypothetical protein